MHVHSLSRRFAPVVTTCSLIVAAACSGPAPAPPPAASPAAEVFERLAARADPYVEKSRVFVLTDIANEPDDQMSMVRFLVYANEYDIEGLVAGTSTWMRNKVRPDVILKVIDAYAQVQPTLATHAPGLSGGRRAAAARDHRAAVVRHGRRRHRTRCRPARSCSSAPPTNPTRGRSGCWPGAARTRSPQALLHVRDDAIAGRARDVRRRRLRVYTISDQDDAGPWIRREFPTLHYIAMPSTPDGDQYYLATWTGISGDRFYRNADGADFTTFTDAWVNAQHPIQGAARAGLHHAVLHSRRGHAVVPRPDQQRPRELRQPDLRRLGRTLCVADLLRRNASIVDAGRRLVSGQGQLARHRRRSRWSTAHLRSGHDLALADRVSARLRGAHGLDDSGRRARESQPASW